MPFVSPAQTCWLLFAIIIWLPKLSCHERLFAQSSQNPSPMVEHIREHPRLNRMEPDGQRKKLELGELYIPTAFAKASSSHEPTPVVLAFHCGDWIPPLAVSRLDKPLPCISFQLGSGSAKYAEPFAKDAGLIDRLVRDCEHQLQTEVNELILVGWSAGYGAIGELLDHDRAAKLSSSVLLIDGLHCSYVGGQPGPQESALETGSLTRFLNFASQATNGEKRMILLHSEIFPGTFASTTETADWLIKELQLQRKPILQWGPMKTQQVGQTIAGKLQIRAFAGNSAPDHIDLLHGLPEFLSDLLRL